MNAERLKTTVLDLSFAKDPKIAALYFDYVIPLYLYPTILDQRHGKEVLPPCLIKSGTRCDPIDEYQHVMTLFTSALVINGLKRKVGDGSKTFGSKTLDEALNETLTEHDEKAIALLERYKFEYAPILLAPHRQPNTEYSENMNLLTLANLPLVDVSKTPWEQLLEFRKDKTSVEKLRKLKLFLSENYIHKDKSFIEDDLTSRLTDYQNAVKDWGFETKTSTFSLLLSSKSLTATAGGTLASILFGAPTLAAVTALSGACIELGKVSLHLANRQYDLLKLQRDHPLAYIIDAKESLEIQPNKTKRKGVRPNF